MCRLDFYLSPEYEHTAGQRYLTNDNQAATYGHIRLSVGKIRRILESIKREEIFRLPADEVHCHIEGNPLSVKEVDFYVVEERPIVQK